MMNTAIAERLDEALIAHDAPEHKEAFEVDTQDKAAWASRNLAKAYQSIHAVSAWEAREIERIKQVADKERARHQSDIDFFEGHLHQYLLREIAAGRKVKSLDLPGGRIQLRARQPKLEILDEGKGLHWLKQSGHGDFIRVKESVDKTALKKALVMDEGVVFLAETGEAVEWASLVEQGDSVSFTPANEEEAEA